MTNSISSSRLVDTINKEHFSQHSEPCVSDDLVLFRLMMHGGGLQVVLEVVGPHPEQSWGGRVDC